MTPLEALIRDEIRQDGPISVARFMALCLGHPEHGYYTRRDPLGASGDFTTAPEVSQLFGEMAGLWIVAMWRAAGAPSPATVVELGPGRGTLMADALRVARQVAPEFADRVEIVLVETSPTLRARQAETLSAASPIWADRFSETPERPTFLIANEFFDALPVRQFERTAAGWREQKIELADDRFRFTLGDEDIVEDPAVASALTAAERAGVAFLEINPMAEAIAGEIGARLARVGGAALIVDYGYDAQALAGSQGRDTLQAMRAHAYVDPLKAPGEADLTAHVDFSSLARALGAAGATAQGPIGQGSFLRRLGVETRAAALAQTNPGRAEEIAAGLHRLTHPREMGRLFKVLAATAPGLASPPGFEAE